MSTTVRERYEVGDLDPTGVLEATGDTLTLKTFYDHVCAIAHQLFLDGDRDPLGVRKIKAIGILTGKPQLSSNARIKAYVRVEAADLQIDGEGGSTLAVGQIEKLGAATLTKIRDWSATTRLSSNPSSTWPAATPSSPTTHPAGCATSSCFATATASSPGCQVDARSCDLDHTIPYDENGPPGQTRPDNLACLCRRHHRAKTTGRWWYLRSPDGEYLWHGPYGTTYLVTTR